MDLTIRKYQSGEETELRKLFYNSIRNVGIKGYTENQVRAWAPEIYDQSIWQARIKNINPFVVLQGDEILGYADVQEDGYIDHFFCHYQYQGEGVGKLLMQTLIKTAIEQGISRLYSHVSITAKAFFEHFGFLLVKNQQVEIGEQLLTNYIMEKHLYNHRVIEGNTIL